MADGPLARVAVLRDALTVAHLDELVLPILAQVRDEVGDLATIRIEAQSLWTGLWNLGATLSGIEVVGFESAHLLHRDFQRLLTEGTRWQWRPQLNLVEALRESKDADEVTLIKHAGVIAIRALTKTIKAIRPGLTELNVAGILEHA